MKYLTITQGMFEQDVSEGRKFYEFFGWRDIEDILYFFSEGEDAEAAGFVCGSSHYTGTVSLEVGDIVVQQGEYKYRLIRKEYSDLFKDSTICNKYEKLLDTIYQSGTLSKELEELYRIEVIGE
tara:strand:- start:3296 stop:3667 length:372 start_codon:yes stop_codon:yes gene_type:complete